MKKFLVLPAVIFALFLGGCGKGKEESKKDKNKLVAQSDIGEIPVYTKEAEPLLAEDSVADFAFVDDKDITSYRGIEGEKVAVADENLMPMIQEDDLFASMPVAQADEDQTDYEFERVNFDFNKNIIKKSQVEKVEKNVQEAKKAVDQGKTVVVSGHTCQMGSASYNLALSLKRADAVKKEMVRNGVPQERVKTLGKGYETPLVWSDETERLKKIKALSANRRAEVVVN
ncbi:MAG: OmpA family protein [bacterium]